MAEDAEKDAEKDTGAEGADAPEEAGEDKDDGAKKPNLVKLGLMIGLPVLILLLAGAGGALLFLGGDEAAETAEADAEGGEGAEGEADAYATYAFEDPIIVQLDAAGSDPKLLSMRLELEIADAQTADLLDERMGRVIDGYAAFLRELTPDDLAGSAGMHRVRLELLRRSRLALGEDAVEGVLITELLVTNS